MVAAGVTVTIPANKVWMLEQLTTDLTTTATVGNRLVRVRINDPLGICIWIGQTSAAIAASQVGGYDVSFGPGAVSTTARRNVADTAQVNVMVREQCPVLFLKAGSTININDMADIDITDSLFYNLTWISFDA